MFTQKQFDDFLLYCKVNNYKQNRFYDNCYEVRKDLFITMDFSTDNYILFTYFGDDIYNTNELMESNSLVTLELWVKVNNY